MSSLELLKNKVRKLYSTHPEVHVNVSINSPRVRLTNEPAVIRGSIPTFLPSRWKHREGRLSSTRIS